MTIYSLNILLSLVGTSLFFYVCFIDYAKGFDCVDHNKLREILQEMGISVTWPASWESCMQVKKQQLELDMEQQTGSKLGKECIKAVHCHPAYLTFMQSTSCEMLGGMKHELESRLPGEIAICRWYHTHRRKQRRTKEPLDESERGEWKSWLQKTKKQSEN